MSDIQALTEQILSFRNERDWKKFHTPKDMVISLMLECAELAEHFQWKNDSEIAELLLSKKQEIGEELSDILYWTLLIAHDFDIDLRQAFERKMEINRGKYPVEKFHGSNAKYSE